MEEYDLFQCIDRALDEFGSKREGTLYWALIRKGIRHDDIMEHPKAFIEALTEVFGEEKTSAEAEIAKEIGTQFSADNAKGSGKDSSLLDTIVRARALISGTTR